MLSFFLQRTTGLSGLIIAILNPKVLLSVAKLLHFQNLFAVFTEVNSAADVNPPRGAAVLQDELIKVGKLLGILQYQPCRLLICRVPERTVPAGDGDVGSLTLQVLRGGYTTHHLVEQLAAVTAVNLDGSRQRSQRFCIAVMCCFSGMLGIFLASAVAE